MSVGCCVAGVSTGETALDSWGMEIDALSDSAQNYLKAIYTYAEWHSSPLTPSLLACYLGLSRPAVSEHIRRLQKLGLVEYSRQGGVRLSEGGTLLALRMVRRHRLVETFLSRILGYSWDEVHDDAERLEHGASDLFLNRVDRVLGYPVRDPHGDPIPREDGSVPETDDVPLLSLLSGAEFNIARVRDREPALLRHFVDIGVIPGARAVVEDIGEGTHAMRLKFLPEGKECMLAHDAARNVLVTLKG